MSRWGWITLGLIAFVGLLVLVVAATGKFAVVIEGPTGEPPPPMAWALAWLFILMSAVIIVAVTAVRLVLKAVKLLRGRSAAPPSAPSLGPTSGPWG